MFGRGRVCVCNAKPKPIDASQRLRRRRRRPKSLVFFFPSLLVLSKRSHSLWFSFKIQRPLLLVFAGVSWWVNRSILKSIIVSFCPLAGSLSHPSPFAAVAAASHCRRSFCVYACVCLPPLPHAFSPLSFSRVRSQIMQWHVKGPKEATVFQNGRTAVHPTI